MNLLRKNFKTKMRNSTLIAIIVIVILIIAAIYFLFQGQMNQNQVPAPPAQTQQTPSTQTAASVNIGSKADTGNFLTGANGMTLYYFAGDTVGKSNCTGACASVWPAFYAPNMQTGSNLNAADFGVITRTDGSNQATYDGWPLYYYSKDVNPGDTNGQGFGGIWFVAANPFYTLLLENKTTAGTYLADPNGKALYVFANDTKGTATANPASACTGVCAQTWTPFYMRIENLILPAMAKKADFTEFSRSDGSSQLAYKGYPLYYYSKDVNPGDTNGNGMNGIWHLAALSGFSGSAGSPAAAPTTRQSQTSGATGVSTGVPGTADTPASSQIPSNTGTTGTTETTGNGPYY
jgi:predicted lipoprotein with Yx(FWY)xxD motif